MAYISLGVSLQMQEYILTKDYIEPFIGNHYKSVGYRNQKILCVGLSSYNDSPSEQFNRNTFREQTESNAKGVWRSKFWTNIMQSITGVHHTLINGEERLSFWNGVSLYNYISSLNHVFKLPKDPVLNPAWESAREPFQSVLKELDPTIVLLFSKGVATDLLNIREENFRYYLNEPEKVVGTNKTISKIGIELYQHKIKGLALPHPSYGFSSMKMHRYIDDLLKD